MSMHHSINDCQEERVGDWLYLCTSFAWLVTNCGRVRCTQNGYDGALLAAMVQCSGALERSAPLCALHHHHYHHHHHHHHHCHRQHQLSWTWSALSRCSEYTRRALEWSVLWCMSSHWTNCSDWTRFTITLNSRVNCTPSTLSPTEWHQQSRSFTIKLLAIAIALH